MGVCYSSWHTSLLGGSFEVSVSYQAGGSAVQAGLGRTLQQPWPRVLVYSQWHQPYYLWAVWEAEAQGFLEKDTSSAELIAALKRVVVGEYAFTSVQLQMIRQRKALPELTVREMEVLKLLAQGLNYEEIAPILNISKGTVRTHMRNLFDKSGTRSRWELVTTAHRLGLLQHEAG